MQCLQGVSSDMKKAMLNDALSLMNVMNNLHVSVSGIKYIIICIQAGVNVSRSGFLKIPDGNHRQPEKKPDF